MEYNTNIVYSDVYRDFQIIFPEVAKLVDDYRPYGYFEIKLWLKDGSVMIFDRITTTLRAIEYDETGKMTEHSWIEEFSNRLARFICLKNKTQIDISKETGISQSTLNRYLTGKSIPTIHVLRRISHTLNCSISDLVDF